MSSTRPQPPQLWASRRGSLMRDLFPEFSDCYSRRLWAFRRGSLMRDGSKLAVVQPLERPPPVPQLRVRPYLHDHPVLQHDNPIRTADRRQPMRDDERRSASLQLLQRFQQQRLRLRVQRTRRLIQNQNRCILEEGPRDREALPLAASQADPSFSDLGLVSLGQRRNKLVSTCSTSCRLNLPKSYPWSGIRDIFANAGREQNRLLKHERDVSAKGPQAEGSHINPIEGDPTSRWVIEAQEQARQRRLPGPGGPDESAGRAGGKCQANVAAGTDTVP